MARRNTIRFRLLPITMLASILLLGVKVGDIARGTNDLSNFFVSEGNAQDAAPEKEAAESADKVDLPENPTKTPPATEEKTADDSASEKTPAADTASTDTKEPDVAESDKADTKPVEGNAVKEPPKEPAKTPKTAASVKSGGDTDAAKQQFSQVQIDLLTNLSTRSAELDKQAKDNLLKESLLMATEQRLNDKIIEIKKLREDVGKMLAQYNQQEDEKIKSLVKIYENMKPKEAARIFEEIDMPILLAVVSAMSERRVSPILANMSSKKAKDLTIELAEQRKLNQSFVPTLPPEPPPPSTLPSAIN